MRSLSSADLDRLAVEIRDLLVGTVSRTGGHLGPNLGVVELTIALHRVFESPAEPILFDVGHQAYVHKIVTGRAAELSTLRQRGGVSGYPSRAESEHDWIENSHASTALSYADGMAKAFELRGTRRPVVAVVGDGALTGGMCWEALNNIATSDRPVVIVVNDNGRSYDPTVGGLANALATLRTRAGYEQVLGIVKRQLPRVPVVGSPVYTALHGVKQGMKDILAPQGLFEDLGLKYLGPIDGHDRAALEQALTLARDYDKPIVVHCVTTKGRGYEPAEHDPVDQMHQSTAFEVATGQRLPVAGRKWTQVFAEELVTIGEARPDVVAISAAMCESTGLGAFAQRFPDRFFDVGIAEQHAITSAAGLASAGLHPVVAVYSTFLNRAFDQVLMDVALHRLPVTIVLDRAGITGDDGASHNGIWDLALLGLVPGLRIAAPRDEPTLRAALQEAVGHSDGPTVVRFPKTTVPPELPALRQLGAIDVLAETADDPLVDVLIVAVGATAIDAIGVAHVLESAGRTTRVVDLRWVLPLDRALIDLAASAALVVSIEDGVVAGGVGSRIAQALADAHAPAPVQAIGIDPQFLAHGTVAQVRADAGLTVDAISRQILDRYRIGPSLGHHKG